MSHARAPRRKDGQQNGERNDEVWNIKYSENIHTLNHFLLRALAPWRDLPIPGF
jgi:hypothetical protein